MNEPRFPARSSAWRPLLLGLACVAAAVAAGGCTSISYYAQAAHGQFSLLAQARPFDDWINDPDAKASLKTKLETVREIRRFAVAELGLPDNGSYKTYAQLDRPFVLWNVVAAPELSLKAHQWCFPVAGCVDYRGYYSQQAAQAYGDQLQQQGYDVQVVGVPAYSTLGWFNDPVISTFINYPDGELARLIFHELAHQTVYARDDTPFNEGFAVAVEEIGVERWLAARHDDKMIEAYRRFDARKQEFLALLDKYRDKLADNYDSDASDADKRRRKQQIFDELRAEYAQVKAQRWNGYAGYDRWFAMPLSNAHLALVGAYHDMVPAFKELFARSSGFPDFYARVRQLAAMDKPARHAALGDPLPDPAPAGRRKDRKAERTPL
ncbi:aminopeptidase [Herbaspirillum robiniae]|uniref:Aminopeptidase n=1 Tax=Herbaspirillum robiniae TaxID=2014887 RepID=A0A246WM99_9BURK|nr:aminopeptidase [Herbaspirillum robiniae]OWY27483.1 aminopeptidase [Herbaspirillum robiniae]